MAERGSVIDGFWLLTVLAHYPPPRVTEERYPSFVTLVRVKLEKTLRTLARREFAMNLPRDAISLTACFANATVSFVDQYCAVYKNLFPEVRSFECFKFLHLGMISQIKRKSLPAIARVAGLEQEQSLHHFLTVSPWQLEQLREQRLKLILQVLEGREIILIIDETGDRKKVDDTDYVKRQYIGNLGKIENGIVAVTAYGVIDGITLPLTNESL